MFARNAVTTLAGGALIAGTLGFAALAGAGTAGAMSSANDTFLAEISAEGIVYDSPKAAIATAHDVCLALDEGADPVDLDVERLEDSDLTTDQAAAFVAASVGTYCPEFGVLFE